MLAACTAASSIAANAQVSHEIIASYAGAMQVMPTDGRPGCRIVLGMVRTIGGRVALPSAGCARHVPRIASAAAWFVDDGVQLIDGARRPVIAFTSDETGLLSSPSVADPVHYLIAQRPGLTKLPTVKTIVGRWRMESVRQPKPCNVTLLAPKPGDQGLHPLTVDQGCPVTGLTHWRIEALTLFLEGPNDRQMAFEPATDTRFDGPNGWRLVR